MKQLASLIGLVMAVWLSGCISTSKVLPIGKDTYSVSATADGMSSASSARERAFEAARLKCVSLGKEFLLVSESVTRTRMGIDTTITITFRALDKDDPEYKRPDIQRSPDVLIQDQRK